MSMLHIKNLNYSYGQKSALCALDLDFSEAALIGLFGHNGSGKSTLLKILSGLLAADSGQIYFHGTSVFNKRRFIASGFREIIGALFQTTSSDALLSLSDNLRYFASIMGIATKDIEGRVKEALVLANLSDQAEIRVKTLSHGMRRRLELYRTFMHRPKFIFLDEPTAGLDIEEAARFWRYIKDYQENEKALVLCATHYPLELEHCHEVVMMSNGSIIAKETSAKLSEELDHWRYEVDIDHKGDVRALKFVRADLGESYEARVPTKEDAHAHL